MSQIIEICSPWNIKHVSYYSIQELFPALKTPWLRPYKIRHRIVMPSHSKVQPAKSLFEISFPVPEIGTQTDIQVNSFIVAFIDSGTSNSSLRSDFYFSVIGENTVNSMVSKI